MDKKFGVAFSSHARAKWILNNIPLTYHHLKRFLRPSSSTFLLSIASNSDRFARPFHCVFEQLEDYFCFARLLGNL